MRRIVAFFALSAGDRALLIEAVAAVVLFRLALFFVGVDRLRAWSGRLVARSAPVDRVAWAVGAASRWVPGATCLASALAAQRLMSVRGCASELHIGVARQERQIAAHAWLESGGRIVIGEPGDEAYKVLTSWRSAPALPEDPAAGGDRRG